MAKVTRNPVVRGIQGSIGNLVFREMPDGKTWVSAKPDFSSRKFSKGQKSHQQRFKEASAYAREASKREPIYAELAAGTIKSPYNIALSDWFHPPVIHEVVQQAQRVQIRASDNIKVVEVSVMILNEKGKVIEKKNAVQVGKDLWECDCDAARIRVEVRDLAWNRVGWEQN